MRYAAVFALTATLLAACSPTPTNTAPTVTLAASPASITQGDSSTLTATVIPGTGTITKVEFFDSTGTAVGPADTSAPYTATYTTTTSTTAGAKTFTAKVTDSNNLSATSTPVTVTVNPAPVPTANVRVVHASSGAPAVDLFLNGSTTAAITNLAFGSTSPTTGYTPIPAVSTTVKVSATGTPASAAVFTSPAFTPTANGNFTVVALGKLTGTPAFTLGVFPDDLTAPSSGNAKVRVIHAASTVTGVDVYASAVSAAPAAPAVFTNLTFGNASTYASVPAGAYKVSVFGTGANPATATAAITIPTVTLIAGKIYTAVALDPAPTLTAPTVLLLTDN